MPSSLDILYIVLAFCLLWLSTAMFWLIWKFVQVLKSVNDAVTDLKARAGRVEDALMSVKSRVERSATSATTWVSGIKQLVDYASERRAKRKASADQDIWETK